ncbi:MAG: hypothetical protein LBS73_00525, partial [Campylobacteraceae bacterium]|nr:hypothetical protein [Campylobacteraceae bacterium]
SPIRKRIKAQNYVENQLCKKAKQFAFFTSFLELRNSLSRSNAPLRLYPTSRFNAWQLQRGKKQQINLLYFADAKCGLPRSQAHSQ